MNNQAKRYLSNLTKKNRTSVINNHLDVIDLFLEHGTLAIPQIARLTKKHFPTRRVMVNLSRFEVIRRTGKEGLWYFQKQTVTAPDYELTDNAADYIALLMDIRDHANE